MALTGNNLQLLARIPRHQPKEAPMKKPAIDDIVRLHKVHPQLNVSTRTVSYWIEKGILPQPLRLGPRARGFRQSTIDAFLKSWGEATR